MRQREIRRLLGSNGECQVQLRGRRTNRNSIGVRARLIDETDQRDVFVKLVSAKAVERHRRWAAGQGPPRIRGLSEPHTVLRDEAAALRAIERMVRDSGRSDWFAVHVIDLRDDGRALLLGDVNMATFAARAGEVERLLVAAESVGSWLRSFHSLATPKPTNSSLSDRDDVRSSLTALLDYLVDHVGDRIVDGLAEQLVELPAVLPAALPVALAHGDFAAHNVFVSDTSQVAVFDTTAKWRLPVHFDLAYFAVMLEFADVRRAIPSLYSPRSQTDMVPAMLTGYGDEAPPEHERAVFEVLVLLEKWAALRHSSRRSGVRSLVKKTRTRVLAQRLERSVRGRLRQVENAL